MIGYLLDDKLKDKLNDAGKNYWDVYIEEILNQLGVSACKLSVNDIERGDCLTDIRTLIIGAEVGKYISPEGIDKISSWVRCGGGIIGFGLKDSWEGLCGIRIESIRKQEDDYSISGYFEWQPHWLTKEIHPLVFMEQRRVMVSDILVGRIVEGEEVAKLCSADGKVVDNPVIVYRGVGDGWVCWFGFDVAKTIWILHQGRPVWGYTEDGDQPRTCELQILGQNSRKVMYADEIVLLLQNVISLNGHPFIYQIPPDGDGLVPDALFYWGGDEYRGPTERSIQASDWMRSRGLGYHINIESEHHPMSIEEAKHIWSNGHELSAYYTLDVPDGKGGYKLGDGLLSEELFIRQSDRFLERFGYRPITSVNHCLRWKGWVEPAKYIERAGGKADNSFAPYYAHRPNPWGNAAFFGSGFGTVFPFFFYDDYNGGNRRINVIEEPIVCYELGHRGTVRGTATDDKIVAVEELHLAVDLAIKYHWVMNMFYHPNSISSRATTRFAIDEILKHIQFRRANVIHMGNDGVVKWWFKRAESELEELDSKDSLVHIKYKCKYSKGMIIRIPIREKVETGRVEVSVNDKKENIGLRYEYGGNWAFVVVPFGEGEVKIKF